MRWYAYIILIFILLLIICFIIGYAIWAQSIPYNRNKRKKFVPTDDPVEVEKREFIEKESKRLKNMNMEDVWIKSKDGLNLHAFYREADVKTNKVIISVHGFRGSSLDSAPIFSHFLVDYNYNILFIDLRGCGESEGRNMTFGVKDSEDLLQWIEYLQDRFQDDVSIALFGLSMGGATVIGTSDKVPQTVKCIIDDCGFTSAWDEMAYVLKTQKKVPLFFLFFAEIINLLVNRWSLRKLQGPKCLSGSRVPVLFIHGTKDTTVPIWMGKKNFDACTSEKYIKVYENAGHARCYFLNKENYKSTILNFLAKRL